MTQENDPLGAPKSDLPSGLGNTSAGAADDSGVLGQDDIEKLLAAAGAGKGISGPPKPLGKPSASASQSDSGIAQNDIEFLLSQAEEALASINSPVDAPHGPPVQPFRLQDFAGANPNAEAATLDLIRDVELDLKIELGRTEMYLEDVLKLRKGSVVPLDKLAGDPVDIYVNGRLIARGEVLVLNDNFCVRVAELIASENVA
jgi:flagellar motor switch protein FliN/FliY